MKDRKSNKKSPNNHFLAAERLLCLTCLLADNRWHTTVQLANTFGITERTILRDLDKIENSLRISIERKRGKGVRIPLKHDFNCIQTGEDEALNLILATAFSSGIGFSLVQISKTLNKLRNSLPSEFAENIFSLSKRFYSEIQETISEKIELIRTAVTQSLIIRFLYKGKKRKVNAYGLIYYRTKFYLLGYDYNHKEIRVFSVNRVQNCKISDEKFKMAEDFDAQNYWQKIFWKKYNKKAETIVLIFDKFSNKENVLLERIKHWEKIKIKKAPDKSTEATFKTLNFEWLRDFILSCGKKVKVKQPDWLKKEIKEEIREMNKLYK